MGPSDVTIRLYLAKAYFGLQNYDRCIGILTDALNIWPDDLLLRINLAFTLEKYSKSLLIQDNAQKAIPVIMKTLNQASQLAHSAARLYDYISSAWASMSSASRTELTYSSCATANLTEEMEKVEERKEYCIEELKGFAVRQIEHYNMIEKDIRKRQDEVANARDVEAKRAEDEAKATETFEMSRLAEIQEQAVRLMGEGEEIQLGQNLEASKLDAIGAAPKAKPAPRPSAKPAEDKKEKKKKEKKEKKKEKKDKKRKREHGSDDDKEETVAFGDGDTGKEGAELSAGVEAAGDAMQLDKEDAGTRAEGSGDIQLPVKDTQDGETGPVGPGSPQDPAEKADASSDDE